MDPNAADPSIQTLDGPQNEPIEELNDEDKKSEENAASENRADPNNSQEGQEEAADEEEGEAQEVQELQGPPQPERFNVNNENKFFLDMAVKLDKIQIIIKNMLQ